VYGASNQIWNYGTVLELSTFLPNTAFWSKLPLA
jgi:hypothetical protein